MAQDSRLWAGAYESMKRQEGYWKSTSKRKKKARVPKKSKSPYYKLPDDPETNALVGELVGINNEIKSLKKRKNVIKERLKNKRYGDRPWILYALKLEEGFYYIGISHNVTRRFVKHVNGKGANWTALHKPLEIIETRKTTILLESEATKLEDDMTIEYAMKYGPDRVRGGGYCQTKPRWPDVVTQNP